MVKADRLCSAPRRLRPNFAGRVVLLCSVAAGSLVQAQHSVPNSDFVVSRPVINMYKEATADSEVTSQVLYGTGVLSLEKKENWVRIQTADGYTGWIALAGVKSQGGTRYA